MDADDNGVIESKFIDVEKVKKYFKDLQASLQIMANYANKKHMHLEKTEIEQVKKE